MNHMEGIRRLPVGYTMVELLVTLLMVGVLGALVFPVFARTREQARLGTCISNMRQIYVALKMYEDDNGHLPVHFGPEDGLRWTYQIAPYTKDRHIFLCPSDGTRGATALVGEPCSYLYCYTRIWLGPQGEYRQPAARSPILLCRAHPDYQMVLGRYDGSVELPLPWRYAAVSLELEQ